MQTGHPIIDGIAEAYSDVVGPMTLEQAQEFYAARQAAAASAYRLLIRDLAHNAPARGVADIDELPALTDEDYRILRATHPELDTAGLHQMVVIDVNTELDVILEQRDECYPQSYYGGNRLTRREQLDSERGVVSLHKWRLP